MARSTRRTQKHDPLYAVYDGIATAESARIVAFVSGSTPTRAWRAFLDHYIGTHGPDVRWMRTSWNGARKQGTVRLLPVVGLGRRLRIIRGA